jgi:hypothetical protein
LTPFSGYGPDRLVRLVVATTDPATLPAINTRYLTTNLPRPGSPRAIASSQRPADLAEVVRLYALRNWVEQGYKQVKHELGWADFMVRSDRAIRRHWQLVCCAFSFCWQSWFTEEAASTAPPASSTGTEATANAISALPAGPPAGRGKNADRFTTRTDHRLHRQLAGSPSSRAVMAGSVDVPLALVAGLVNGSPTSRDSGTPASRGTWAPTYLPPGVTNHR